MHKIEDLVSSLLLRHSCVIIPNFGGFVAKSIAAKLDLDRGLFLAPSKQLLFNKNLLNNDGLLISEYANLNAIEYSKSQSEIEEFVLDLKSKLNSKQSVHIERVGKLSFDIEGNLVFEQDRYFNLLLSSYGLSQVQFIANKEPEINEISINEKKKKEIAPIRKINYLKYAAAACLLPIAFYSLWIPLKTNVLSSKRISINDLNPFHQKRKINYVKNPLSISEENAIVLDESIEEQYNRADLTLDYWYYEYDGQKQFTILNEPKEVEIIDTEDKEVIVEDVIVPDIPNQIDIITPFTYNCIAGCFSNYTNATRLVKELKEKGYDASILPGGKFYQVSLGGGFSREAVYSIQANADQDSIPVWILH
jgi:hypothetical protein